MIIVIGEAPSKIGNSNPIASGSSTGNHMRRLLGTMTATGLNVFDEPLAHGWRSDLLPEARRRAEALRGQLGPTHELCLLLGRNVASAFGIQSAPYFLNTCASQENEVHEHALIVIPHPSGKNRWWNKPENRQQADEFFAELRKGG